MLGISLFVFFVMYGGFFKGILNKLKNINFIVEVSTKNMLKAGFV